MKNILGLDFEPIIISSGQEASKLDFAQAVERGAGNNETKLAVKLAHAEPIPFKKMDQAFKGWKLKELKFLDKLLAGQRDLNTEGTSMVIEKLLNTELAPYIENRFRQAFEKKTEVFDNYVLANKPGEHQLQEVGDDEDDSKRAAMVAFAPLSFALARPDQTVNLKHVLRSIVGQGSCDMDYYAEPGLKQSYLALMQDVIDLPDLKDILKSKIELKRGKLQANKTERAAAIALAQEKAQAALQTTINSFTQEQIESLWKLDRHQGDVLSLLNLFETLPPLYLNQRIKEISVNQEFKLDYIKIMTEIPGSRYNDLADNVKNLIASTNKLRKKFHDYYKPSGSSVKTFETQPDLVRSEIIAMLSNINKWNEFCQERQNLEEASAHRSMQGLGEAMVDLGRAIIFDTQGNFTDLMADKFKALSEQTGAAEEVSV